MLESNHGQVVTKLADQAQAYNTTTTVTPDKEMREVLAALELENKNTPRGSLSPNKKSYRETRSTSTIETTSVQHDSLAGLDLFKPPIPSVPSKTEEHDLAEKWEESVVAHKKNLSNFKLSHQEENITPRDLMTNISKGVTTESHQVTMS